MSGPCPLWPCLIWSLVNFALLGPFMEYIFVYFDDWVEFTFTCGVLVHMFLPWMLIIRGSGWCFLTMYGVVLNWVCLCFCPPLGYSTLYDMIHNHVSCSNTWKVWGHLSRWSVNTPLGMFSLRYYWGHLSSLFGLVSVSTCLLSLFLLFTHLHCCSWCQTKNWHLCYLLGTWSRADLTTSLASLDTKVIAPPNPEIGKGHLSGLI